MWYVGSSLQQAGISRKLAPRIGIAVDHRRTNHSLESLQGNVQRLKEYQSKLVLFPRRAGKQKKGDADVRDIFCLRGLDCLKTRPEKEA